MNDRELAQEVVDRLNDLLVSHPEMQGFLTGFIELRHPAPTQLAVEHPTIQATSDYQVGFLGVLNGLVGAIRNGSPVDGYGHIAAVYSDDENNPVLQGFMLTPLDGDWKKPE